MLDVTARMVLNVHNNDIATSITTLHFCRWIDNVARPYGFENCLQDGILADASVASYFQVDKGIIATHLTGIERRH